MLDDVALLDTNSIASGDIAYGPAVVAESNTTATPDAVTRFPGNTTQSSAAWYGGELVDTGNVASQIDYDPTRASANEPPSMYLTPGDANVPGAGVTFITAAPATGSYGGNTTLSATLTSGGAALVNATVTFSLNGATVGTATTDSSGTATLSGVGLAGFDAGTYTACVGADFVGDANHFASNGAADLTVNTAPLTVSGITAADKVYDGTTAATLNTGNAALVGLVGGTVTLNFSGASGTFASQDAGKKIPVSISGLTLSGPQAGDYSLEQPSTKAKITPAPLTVTADNKSRLYGTNNPTLTASYSGFVHGETLLTSGVTGSPSLSTSATTTSPPGSYAIPASAGSLSASNYTFQFVAGRLTVASPTITWTGGALTNNWGDAANWSSGCVPGSFAQVVIGAPGPLTINYATGNVTIYSLTSLSSQVVLDFTGGSLALLADSIVNGPVNNGASLIAQGGTLSLNGGGNDVGGTFVADAGASLILGGAVSLDGTTTISGPGTIQLADTVHAAGALSLNAAVSLPNTGTTVDTAGFAMTLGGTVSGGGTGGLTKTGSGVLTLSGANSYLGGTTVLEGTLLVSNASALPDGSSLIIGASATFVFGGSVTAASGSLIVSPASMAIPPAALIETASLGNVPPLTVPTAQSATPVHEAVNPFAVPCSPPIVGTTAVHDSMKPATTSHASVALGWFWALEDFSGTRYQDKELDQLLQLLFFSSRAKSEARACS